MTCSVFSIAPHAPFLPTLVDRVLDGTLPGLNVQNPDFGLADLTIIVPTRRARTVLADAFLAKAGGSVLLPDIRTFGEQPEDEEPFLPPFDAKPIPPTIGLLSRRIILARLVQAWIKQQEIVPFSSLQNDANAQAIPPSPAEVLALADSLGELIDDCNIEAVLPSAIKSLAPEDLSENWQQSLHFLSIVLDTWPHVLTEREEVDSSFQRNLRMKRQAEAAHFIYGDKPVIAAGSTGSIPATADLLAAIANLPNGALVLPGLDGTIDSDAHLNLIDEKAATHGHPQFTLAHLLRRLGTTHSQVHELAGATNARRSHVIRQALALPKDTANWSIERSQISEADMADACDDISICVAKTQEEEARAIALAVRQALEDRKTVAVVSPDRNLTRRIAAELARFDIVVDDSAGAPLFQSRMGRLIRQAIAICINEFAPVDLMAFLRNRYVTLRRRRSDVTKLTDALELGVLRGQRPTPGIVGLTRIIEANRAGEIPRTRHRLKDDEALDLTEFLVDLDEILSPLREVIRQGSVNISILATHLKNVIAAIIKTQIETDSPPDGYDVFLSWVDQMLAMSGQGPSFSGRDILSILQGLMAGMSVRQPGVAREDVAVFGVLEARLQNADLMILAGLNEGIWPQPADPGPWLSRNMRIQAGLQPPERQQGQMAHDFSMAMGNKNVLITLADRVGTSPALPSRLIQRVEAYLGATHSQRLRENGDKWTELARRLDLGHAVKPAVQPLPTPPANLRPRKLSVTEVETLIRSPYDLYAKHVLKLRPLDPLGDDPDIRERGTLVHEIFALFVERDIDPCREDAQEILLTIADEVFETLETARERRAVWRRRLEKQAEGYLSFERARTSEISSRHVERDGEWHFEVSGVPFKLYGRADRIDRTTAAQVEIIDFKTGGIPTPAEMREFTAPQLLVEAAIARHGNFTEVATADTSALTYIKLAAGPKAFEVTDFALRNGMDIGAATDELMQRLYRHIDAFLLSDTLPMAARIFPKPNQTYKGDYDHLSRMDEWTEIDGEGDEV